MWVPRGNSQLLSPFCNRFVPTPEASGRVAITYRPKNGIVLGSPRFGSAMRETYVPVQTPLPNSKNIDPIPLDWRELGKHKFEVPAGGTKDANFDITNPRVK